MLNHCVCIGIMPTYTVEFVNVDGRTGTEQITAPDEGGAAAMIESSGRTPIDVHAAKPAAASHHAETIRKSGRRSKRVRRAVVAMVQQLTSVVESGLPVLTGLRVIAEQTEDTALAGALTRVASRIEGGEALAEALDKEPRYFAPVFVKTVATGEASGHLAEVLDSLGRFEEQELENAGNVKSALIYPGLVVSALVIATILMLWFVIPQFATMFAKFGANLPLLTRVLLKTSTFVRDWALLLVAATFAVPFVWRKLFSLKAPRKQLDQLKFRVPVFGPLLLNSSMERLIELLNLMNRSSLPIVQALRLTADAMENVVLREDVQRLAHEVEGGQTLAEAFSKTKWISPLVKRMLTVGEESGRTDRIFEYLGRYYRVQTQRAIKNLSTLIEPILIAGLAGIVLLFSLAIFQPMWQMLKLVGAH